MHDFKDTFNMFVGTVNTDIDLWDNPYIQPNVYELDHHWKPKLSNTIKLRKCTEQDLLEFVAEQALWYYKNAICFEDKSKIHLQKNWFGEEFKSIYISLDACNSGSYNG